MTVASRMLFIARWAALLLGALPGCKRDAPSVIGKRVRDAGGPPPALAAHTLLHEDQNKGVSPARTAPVSTPARGAILLALAMGRTVNFVTPVDSYGNRWSLLGKRNDYAHGPFYTAMWAALDARGGPDHTISVRKDYDPADELSLAFIAVENGAAVADFAYAYPPDGRPVTPGTVKTSGPATLIAVWGGDADDLSHKAAPDEGWQVIDSYLELGPTSGVQVVIATRQVTAAGTYTVTWTSTPVQRAACYLVAIE